LEASFDINSVDPKNGGNVLSAFDAISSECCDFDVIISYENVSVNDLYNAFSCERMLRSGKQNRIVFIRDFFNSYASQFSWFEKRLKKSVPVDQLNGFRKS